MGRKIRIYARALHECLQGTSLAEQKKRIRVFKCILKKRRDIKMSNGILQEFQRLEQEQKGKIAKVVSASNLATSVKAMLVATLKPMKFVLQDRIDPAVIGGVAVFLGKEFLIDNTVIARLRKLSHGEKLSF